MKDHWLAVCGVVLTGLFLLPVMAMAGMQADMSKMGDQAMQAGEKLTRGAANVAMGWMEFPKMTLRSEGPGVGMQRAIRRTFGGLTDLVTFPVEPYDETYIEPEYFSP